MFSFIRRAFRPIASIGEKLGEIFRIGRKAEPMGVFREKVLIESGSKPFSYTNIPKFHQGGGSTGLPKGEYLRPFDEMGRGGGFTGYKPSYIGN